MNINKGWHFPPNSYSLCASGGSKPVFTLRGRWLKADLTVFSLVEFALQAFQAMLQVV